MTAPARDRHYDAHQAAEAHLGRLDEFEEEVEQTGDYDREAPASAGPYCACDTCTIREALAAAWPHALAHAADLAADVAAAGPGRLHVVKALREEARKATLAGLDVPA